MQKRKPLHSVRATALAALSRTLGSVFTVVASPELKVTKAEVATYGCKHCSTKFGALASTQPFCITCGSDEVQQVENEPTESLTDGSDLSAVTCNHCSTHNILSVQTASTLKGRMFCTACGEPIGYTAPELSGEDGGAADVEDIEEDLDTDTLGGDDVGGDQEEIGGEDEVLDGEADDAEEDAADEEPTEEDEYAGKQCAETVDVDLVDTVTDEDTEVAFTLVEGTLVATVNGVPVATLDKEAAGVNSDVYTKKSFTDAVSMTMARTGISAGLKHYGFSNIVVAFPLKKLVAAGVDAEMQTIRAKEESKVEDVIADLSQCLAIASLGLNKNFFKGKDNALKAGFYEELSNAGVVNPAKVVERVFAHYGEAYVTTLLATAEELLAKNVDVRNQLAEAVDAVNPVSVDDESEDDVSDLNNVEVTARLAGSTLRPQRKSAETASVSVSTIRKALPGGRLF